MDYYPIYLDLKGKKCLVVGGGNVARRKIMMLKRAGAEVTVVAPEINPDILGVTKIEREFIPEDVEGFTLVISATSNSYVNKRVSEAARSKNIIVNVVDDKMISDFISPSVVERKPFLIAISTEGRNPVLTKKMRRELERRFDNGEFKELIDENG